MNAGFDSNTQLQRGAASPRSSLLRHLVAAVGEVPKLDTLLEALLREAAQVLGASHAVFWRLDWGARTRTVALSYADGVVFHGQLWPSAAFAVTTAIPTWPDLAALQTAPAPLAIDHATLAARDWPRSSLDGTILLAPVMFRGALAACLSFHAPSTHMREDGLALAQEAADHVSLAMYVSTLAERSERAAVLEERQRQLEAQIAQSDARNSAVQRSLAELADDPDLDWFLGNTLAAIVQEVHATIGDIFLYDPDDGTLTHRIAVRDGRVRVRGDAPEPDLFQQPFPADITPAFAAMCQSRMLVLLSGGRDDLLWPGMAEWHRAQGNGEALAVALVAGEQPLGALGLAFRSAAPLTAAQKQAVQSAATQATLAIQLSRLAAQSRQAAMLEERTRMAREIHDTLAQGLAGIIVQLQAATDAHTTDLHDQTAHVAAAIALAKHSLGEARRSVRALRPAALEQSDLAGALRSLTRHLGGQARCPIAFSTRGTRVPLPEAVEAELLRVAQEALANALAHADAAHLRVELVFAPAELRLAVFDDGRGFDPEVVGDGCFGIVGMRERAARIGAAFSVESVRGHGTAVVLTVPLASTATESNTP